MKVHRILTPDDDAREFSRPELCAQDLLTFKLGQLPRTDGRPRTEQNVKTRGARAARAARKNFLEYEAPYPQDEVVPKTGSRSSESKNKQKPCVCLTSANCKPKRRPPTKQNWNRFRHTSSPLLSLLHWSGLLHLSRLHAAGLRLPPPTIILPRLQRNQRKFAVAERI